MLFLDKKSFISKGAFRYVYNHPADSNKIIKIDIQDKNGNKREIEAYNKFNQSIKNFTPKFFGEIETNLGKGLIFEKIYDYDSKKQASQPLEAYEYYYTDPETNETVVIKGTENAVINDDEIPVYLGFLLRAKMNMNTFGDIVQKVFIVLAVLVVFGLIVLWFKSWSRREDEAKAQIYGKKNQSKRKKRKK